MSNWSFGTRLKKIRIDKGISQEELAKRMGLSNRSSITHLEKGRNNPTTDVVERLAQALGVSPADFFIEENADASDIIPYLMRADEVTLDIIRRILKMPGY